MTLAVEVVNVIRCTNHFRPVTRTRNAAILRRTGWGHIAALTCHAMDGMLIGMQRESQSGLVHTVVDL